MALQTSLQLATVENGVSTTVYMNIPRSEKEGFFMYPNSKQVTFPFNIWTSEQAREDSRTDPSKKPVRVINVRMKDCTQEDIVGVPGVPAEFDEEGNRTAEAIPAKIGVKESDDADTYTCSYNEIINSTTLLTYVHDHMLDTITVNGVEEPLGMERAKVLGIVNQFYTYIKTNETDFKGIDMTEATDHS